MSNLLAIREKIKSFYAAFEIYITPALKFITAFVTLLLINKNLGFMGKIGSTAIVLIVALMCSFLPLNFIILFATVFIMAHMYKLSLEIAVFTLCLFLLLYLLYFRFSPKDTFVVVLTPVCFLLKIPYVVPLSMGLIGTPASMISVGCGVIVYYLIRFVHVNASAITQMDPDGSVVRFRYIVDGMLGNKAMLMTIVAFAATITVVYVIRRLAVDHAWTIAIISGSLVNVVVLLAGDLLYDTRIALLGTFAGAIVSAAIAVVLMFFVFNVDYSRTEKVQFEDDDYYYYVKAVPKNTVAPKDRSVKRINAQGGAEENRTANIGTRTADAVRNRTMARTTNGTTRPAGAVNNRVTESGVRPRASAGSDGQENVRIAGTPGTNRMTSGVPGGNRMANVGSGNGRTAGIPRENSVGRSGAQYPPRRNPE